jgi:hypothetical protein
MSRAAIRSWLVVVVVLGIATSCRRGEAETQPPPKASAVEPAKAPKPGAGSDPAVAGGAPEPQKIGDVLGDKSLLPLTPENIRDKVAPIVMLKSNGATADSWTFSGENPPPSIPWAQAQFGARGKGWAFGQLSLMFRPSSGGMAPYFDAITERIRTKLGKPAENKKAPANGRRAVWKLQRSARLTVEESVDPNEGPLVEVRVSVPDGDPG